MIRREKLFHVLGIDPRDKTALQRLATETGLPRDYLLYLHKADKLPSASDLTAICRVLGLAMQSVKLRLGFIDQSLLDDLSRRASEVVSGNGASAPVSGSPKEFRPKLTTGLGSLFRADCVELMCSRPTNTYDLIFADPPFNLNKEYPSNIDDSLKDEDYLLWCYEWLDQCIRTLKFGGSLFVYNLPKWNLRLGDYLSQRLTFRHSIAVDIKMSLPIAGRLYPSHYSLLYFVKGDKPRVFKPDRMPMEVCPDCFRDLKDYGGYKDKMNPDGVNLTDVWTDIPPVRHSKYKRRKGANELSIKLLDRVIELATNEGDLVFDPFGGSGTTYVVAEAKKRRWEGVEIGPVEGIMERLKNVQEEAGFIEKFRERYNALFPPTVNAERKKRGLWTSESVRSKAAQKQTVLFD